MPHLRIKHQKGRSITLRPFFIATSDLCSGLLLIALFLLQDFAPERVNQVQHLLRRVDTELLVDIGNMGLSRMNRDVELLGYVVSVAALGDDVEDLCLALRELIEMGNFRTGIPSRSRFALLLSIDHRWLALALLLWSFGTPPPSNSRCFLSLGGVLC